MGSCGLRFREHVEGAMGAAQAFADDVLAGYLVPMTEEGA